LHFHLVGTDKLRQTRARIGNRTHLEVNLCVHAREWRKQPVLIQPNFIAFDAVKIAQNIATCQKNLLLFACNVR